MSYAIQRPGSPNWYARITAWDAKKGSMQEKTVSLRMAVASHTKAEADRAAQELQDYADTQAPGMATRGSREEAERVVDNLARIMGVEAGSGIVWSGAAEDWLLAKVGTVSEATLEDYRGIIASFLAHLGGDQPLPSITAAQVVTWRTALVESGADATANKKLAIVRGILSRAVNQGHIHRNPAASTGIKQVAASERIAFTKEQTVELLNHAAEFDEEWGRFLHVLLYTGARAGDALQLGAANIEDGHLRFLMSKGQSARQKMLGVGKRVQVPLFDKLKRQIRPVMGDKYWFPELCANGVKGTMGASNQFRLLLDASPVEVEQTETPGGKTHRNLTLHSLRHTHTTRLIEARFPDNLVSLLQGRAVKGSVGGYTHVDLEEVQAMLEGVEWV